MVVHFRKKKAKIPSPKSILWLDHRYFAIISVFGKTKISFGYRNNTHQSTMEVHFLLTLIYLLDIMCPLNTRKEGGDVVKSVSIRMPEELLSWLREKAARETIRQDTRVSINGLAVDILTKAMKADKKKGG